MEIELPQEVRCRVTCEGNPVRGVALMAKLGTTRKNSYSFFIGPTAGDGCASLLRDKILSDANAMLERALPDYHRIESVFSGRMSVHVMTVTELKRALEAYQSYKNSYPFPEGYTQMLRESMAVVKSLGYERLLVEATVVPDSIQLGTQRIRRNRG